MVRVACLPSSQYCWWKEPKPHGGLWPGGQAAAGVDLKGESIKKRLKDCLVTCTMLARLCRGKLPRCRVCDAAQAFVDVKLRTERNTNSSGIDMEGQGGG